MADMYCNIFLRLRGNIKMPALGLGTALATDDKLEKALEVALETGYRLIDTAQSYGNEEIIGNVLKRWFDSGKLKREDVFIITKLPLRGMHPDKVEDNIQESLKKLQLDYVDLYLIHFPIAIVGEGADTYGDPNIDYIDVWKKMEEQYVGGRAKSIGVANFNIKKLDRLLDNCRVTPAANEVEVNVYVQQRELVDFCTKRGIAVVAYCPLGFRRTKVLPNMARPTRVLDIEEDDTLIGLSKKHSKTPVEIALRFLIQSCVVPIPKSVTPERLKENFDIFDFSLDEEDMTILRKLEIGSKARVSRFRGDRYGRLYEHPDFEL